MNVFISWSGLRSKAVAEALHAWLPNVIQLVRPWLSAADLEKGARWGSEVAKQLQGTQFGIICVTPENLAAPWIHFEAGALSKVVDSAFVCPYLFAVDASELKGPLVQFQTTRADEEDTHRLVRTINVAMGPASLASNQLDAAFKVWWPRLAERLENIADASEHHPNPRRSDRELLEETLELVRDLVRLRLLRPDGGLLHGRPERLANEDDQVVSDVEKAVASLKNFTNEGQSPQTAVRRASRSRAKR